MFDLAAFTLGVFASFLFFGAADPVKAPVLAQVINHPRPFFRCEQAVESFGA